ncbi:aminodeoxychorismate lyase [Gordonia caeni]|uniref:Aminodeoxychorismate lyase n=1 Tax=Gordonia caeni TaxID=1007097 RepID=A0ABP7NXJ5_9ACTN
MSLVVVSGDGRVCDPEQPLLFADDLAALRGDGVFETVLVRNGRALLVDRHLDRLVDGAAALALPPPDRAGLHRAVAVAAGEWAATAGSEGGTVAEGMLRVSYSRGRESRPDGPPTCYLTVGPVAGRVAAARRDGVSAITLERGLATETAAQAPWLLTGIKALAYAANTAALRHAAQRGADDAIFLAADGSVLEGPRSTVVIASGGALSTPPRSGAILPGTTQAALFDLAAARGIPAMQRRLTLDDLRGADGVWLLSSISLAARVHTLDGASLALRSGLDVAALVDEAVADR